MGIEADKESIGSIVWVDRCKFAQDRANEGDHNTSDIGVLWAEDHIVTQAAAIEALEAVKWHPMDTAPHGVWILVSTVFGTVAQSCWNSNGWWTQYDNVRLSPENATGWQRMPTPPADTGESE